eukprot:6128271-Pleurochrysis_carterae.AAC.1
MRSSYSRIPADALGDEKKRQDITSHVEQNHIRRIGAFGEERVRSKSVRMDRTVQGKEGNYTGRREGGRT